MQMLKQMCKKYNFMSLNLIILKITKIGMLHFKVMIVLLIRNFTEEIFGILVFFFTAHQMRIAILQYVKLFVKR